MRRWRNKLQFYVKHGLRPPPGYGPPGPGNAVFSVSSFMVTLKPADENADELMTAGATAD